MMGIWGRQSSGRNGHFFQYGHIYSIAEIQMRLSYKLLDFFNVCFLVEENLAYPIFGFNP